MQYMFTIANLKMKVYTEQPLIISEAFEPFRIQDTEKEDVTLFFEAVDDMKYIPEKYVYEDFFGNIYEVENEYIREFSIQSHKKKVYATARFLSDSQIQVKYLKEYAENIANIRSCFMHIDFAELMIRHKRLILHSSFIQTKYGGLLFSGPSGIGKSTQAALWKKHRGSEIINGDKTILKQTGKMLVGFGSPYAGSSRYFVNKSSRITAIIFLEKATHNEIERLSLVDAFRKLYSQMIINTWDRNYIENLSAGIEMIVRHIPVYRLFCTPDVESVEYLENFLDKEFHCG